MKDEITLDSEELDGITATDAATERIDLILAEQHDQDAALTDLLTDVMHWAKSTGHDFDAALKSAEMHFSRETDDADED